MNEYKNLFSPFKIGSVELKNRLFVPGMGTNLASTTEKREKSS